MTKEEIKTYEMCKSHIQFIDSQKIKLPFGIQKYGCATGSSAIENTLEKIHREMYIKISDAFGEAKEQIENIIKLI